MKDVAKEAGVSKATVSYVVSGNPLISESTAERVRAAMDRLGYTVNHAAKTLSTAKTNTIGVLAPVSRSECFSLSMGSYLYGIAAAARARGYDTMLFVDENGVEAMRSAVSGMRVDGAIVMDVCDGDPRLDVAVKSGLPVVLLGRPEDSRGLDVVDTDFEHAGEALVRHVAACGHRDVIFVGWPEGLYARRVNYAVRFRAAVFATAESMGIHLRAVYSRESTLGSSETIRSAVEAWPDATAMIIHDDAAVVSAMQTISDMGMTVPGDMSVAAVVPDQIAIGTQVPLDAVCIDVEAVAERCVETLLRRMGHPSDTAVCTLLDQPLRVNGTVAAPRR